MNQPTSSNLQQTLPLVLLAILFLWLLGVIVFRHAKALPDARPQAPTAAYLTATPADVLSVAGELPNPTTTISVSGDEIPVGFAPGQQDSTIASDTARTFLGPVEWVNGQKNCLIAVSYTDDQGQAKESRVWGMCSALGINAPDPTPAALAPTGAYGRAWSNPTLRRQPPALHRDKERWSLQCNKVGASRRGQAMTYRVILPADAQPGVFCQEATPGAAFEELSDTGSHDRFHGSAIGSQP